MRIADCHSSWKRRRRPWATLRLQGSPRLEVTYSSLSMTTILPSTFLRPFLRITEHFQPTCWSLVAESGFHSSDLGHLVYVMHEYQVVLLVFSHHHSFLVFPDCSQFIFSLCAVPRLWNLAGFADESSRRVVNTGWMKSFSVLLNAPPSIKKKTEASRKSKEGPKSRKARILGGIPKDIGKAHAFYFPTTLFH